MGLRFRKSINLGKFFRINLSKSGIGTSSGVKGFRVSHGPRGKRTTASIPGTGISYVKETRKPSAKAKPSAPNSTTPTNNKRTCGVIAIAATAILGLCGVGTLIVSALGGGPEPTEDINQAIDNLYITMTMEAAVKSRYLELTEQAPPAENQEPTQPPALTLTPVPANTLAPSQTPIPTHTAVSVIPTQPPPANPPAGPCNCGQDYNCSHFATHNEAQTCFTSCGGSPSYNWSGLDRDRNGLACESLP